MSKKFKPKIGDLVVVSHALDATVYRVKSVDGFVLGVVDTMPFEGRELATQYNDVTIFKPLSVGQLKRFTNT